MTRTIANLTLAGGVIGVLATAPDPVGAQDIGIPLGETPPVVTVQDLDGQAVDLGQYIGERPVLVEFWATWCPLCAELEPALAAAQRRFGDRVAFLVIAVGVNQTPESIRRHLEDHTASGRVLFDGEGNATRAFHAPATSYIVILDAAGRVAYTGAGAEQDLTAALTRVAGEPTAGEPTARRPAAGGRASSPLGGDAPRVRSIRHRTRGPDPCASAAPAASRSITSPNSAYACGSTCRNGVAR